MRFAIRSGGLAILVFAGAASAQTPQPPVTPETAPLLFRFEGDRMQIIPPPGAPADRPYTYRLDERKLELLPAPGERRFLAPGQDGKLSPEKPPPGELCLLSMERCPQDAEIHRKPYEPGTAKLYALN